jgi:hypothetical protein
LSELGDPAKLASKYRDDKNYLIGPEHFDTYFLILKIVMAAVVLGAGLGKAIELFVNSPVNIVQGIAELITAIISGAFQGFTWVTVIFAVNERFAYYKLTDLKKNEWSISDLPEIPKKEELIKPVDIIVSIIFTVFFIVIFNFSSQFIGVYNFESGKLVSVIPIFSEQVLKSFMPLILTLFCLSILKECIKLIIGKWNLTSGLAVATLNIISLVFCAVIFTDPAIWNGNFIKDLKLKLGDNQVKVTARDNMDNSVEYLASIAYYGNTDLIIAVGFGALYLVTILIFVIAYKRKKKKVTGQTNA